MNGWEISARRQRQRQGVLRDGRRGRSERVAYRAPRQQHASSSRGGTTVAPGPSRSSTQVDLNSEFCPDRQIPPTSCRSPCSAPDRIRRRSRTGDPVSRDLPRRHPPSEPGSHVLARRHARYHGRRGSVVVVRSGRNDSLHVAYSATSRKTRSSSSRSPEPFYVTTPASPIYSGLMRPTESSRRHRRGRRHALPGRILAKSEGRPAEDAPLDVTTGQPEGPLSPDCRRRLHRDSRRAGGWYVGGQFTHVAGVPRSNLAHLRSDVLGFGLEPESETEPSGRCCGTKSTTCTWAVLSRRSTIRPGIGSSWPLGWSAT